MKMIYIGNKFVSFQIPGAINADRNAPAQKAEVSKRKLSTSHVTARHYSQEVLEILTYRGSVSGSQRYPMSAEVFLRFEHGLYVDIQFGGN